MSCPHISRAVKVDGGSGKAGETAGTGKGARGQGWSRSMRRDGREQAITHTHRVLEFHLY